MDGEEGRLKVVEMSFGKVSVVQIERAAVEGLGSVLFFC